MQMYFKSETRELPLFRWAIVGWMQPVRLMPTIVEVIVWVNNRNSAMFHAHNRQPDAAGETNAHYCGSDCVGEQQEQRHVPHEL